MARTIHWLARREEALPAGSDWLADEEAARVERLRYPKRRTEYLLRRLVAKHAVALLVGRSTAPATLAAIEVRNAPDGAPYVLLDGGPTTLEISLTDRAGWAVCTLTHAAGTAGPAGGAARGELGCDLELVEPRTEGFLRTFLTAAEQEAIARQPAGEPRHAAANLLWSAKESALKVLRTGLRRDVREVAADLGPPGAAGWGPLTTRVAGQRDPLSGWWRRDGRFVLTVVTTRPGPPPAALGGRDSLAGALPRHSWLGQPPLR
jgi:4'-phosphopantetheinyl transferase